MMKKMSKIIVVFLIMFFVIPVFAKEGITVESIMGTTLNEKVTLNAADAIDVSFNDLEQNATYKIVLKNDTEESYYVTDLLVEGASEEFLEIILKEESTNVELIPGKETEVEVIVKTLDITQAGRNFNDTVQLKLVLGDVVKNPETSNNYLVYILLIGTILITLSTMFTKLDKKKKLSIFVIGALVLGTTIVYATDEDVVELEGKVSYTSQNLMQSSGTELNEYKISYINSVNVWKHADKVKNIIISDDKIKPEEYEYRYDLSTSNSKKIYGYLIENGDDKTPYDLYIVANGIIYAPEDATGLFSFPNVEKIQGLEFVEFANTKNMTAMFMGDRKLKSIKVEEINTTSAENTSFMFNGCEKLNVSADDFDLTSTVNKHHMFNEQLVNVLKTNSISDKNINFNTMSSSGKYFIENTKDETNPIYYYRGNVTNNNVIFANKCWRMVRTTDTGGIKLIYNGELRTAYENYSSLAFSNYTNIIDKSESQFSYNTSLNKWFSTNHTHNSNSMIIFSIGSVGNYILNYEISSETNYDIAYFYKNGNLLQRVSGRKSGTIDLGQMNPSDIVQVKYKKDVSVHSGNDEVSFYIASGTKVTPAICDNKVKSTVIGTASFNDNYRSPANVGYMYGKEYNVASVDLSAQNVSYKYGSSITWDGSEYVLSETITSSNWNADYEVLTKEHRYTCLNSTGKCSQVYYIVYHSSGNIYYITLDNGTTISKAYREMNENSNDSQIKSAIDNWYKDNLITYQDYIEDTVWCNDRTITDGMLKDESTLSIGSGKSSLFAAYSRRKETPSLACSKKDSFTTEEKNGNGKLTYPIGMLTADEMTLAGSGAVGYSENSYLRTGATYWTMSPAIFGSVACNFYMTTEGKITNRGTIHNHGIRPVISLKNDISYVSGTGTVSDPYIVE